MQIVVLMQAVLKGQRMGDFYGSPERGEGKSFNVMPVVRRESPSDFEKSNLGGEQRRGMQSRRERMSYNNIHAFT